MRERSGRGRVRRWIGPLALSASAHAALALMPFPERASGVRAPTRAEVAVELLELGAPAPASTEARAEPAVRAEPGTQVRASASNPHRRERSPASAAATLLPGPEAVPGRPAAAVAPVLSGPSELSGLAGLSALSSLPGVAPPALPGATDHAARGAYAERVRSHIEAVRHYPGSARRRRLEGEVTLAILVAPDGRLAATPRVMRSSGASLLDREATRMARAAAPFPPSGLPGALEIIVPLRFSLRDP